MGIAIVNDVAPLLIHILLVGLRALRSDPNPSGSVPVSSLEGTSNISIRVIKQTASGKVPLIRQTRVTRLTCS